MKKEDDVHALDSIVTIGDLLKHHAESHQITPRFRLQVEKR